MDDSVPPADLARVAERAVRAGGDYLAEEFRTGAVAGEYGPDDVKAEADREAEARVVEVLHEAYPEHAIHTEEAGRSGTNTTNTHEWVVDPLDGTNNFASGLPTFACAVAVRRAEETLVAAIYEPIPDDLYLAVRGDGATVSGEELTAGSDVGLREGTVSLVLGLSAIRESSLSRAGEEIRDALDGECKRVLETWAPCVDFGLLTRGSIEGLVAFHPDPFEQYAGELLASEAGVVAERAGPLYVAAGDESTLSQLWRTVQTALDGG